MELARFCFVAAAAVMLAACDLVEELFEEQINILDAARIYEENPGAFVRVRENFPGPFIDPRRIPAFDPEDDRPEDVRFLEDLQQSIPVETIYLFTRGKGRPDNIEVVLGTYGLSVSGSLVSVIFFENFVREQIVGPGVEVFDECNERALEWLRMNRGNKFTIAYCRLNDNWYAFQDDT